MNRWKSTLYAGCRFIAIVTGHVYGVLHDDGKAIFTKLICLGKEDDKLLHSIKLNRLLMKNLIYI